LQVNAKILEIPFNTFELLNLFLPSFRLCSFDKQIAAEQFYGEFYMGSSSEIYVQASVLGNT
jgi:hypothetical protein